MSDGLGSERPTRVASLFLLSLDFLKVVLWCGFLCLGKCLHGATCCMTLEKSGFALVQDCA